MDFGNMEFSDESKSTECLPLCHEEFSKFTSTVAKVDGSKIPDEYLPPDLGPEFLR